MKKYLVAGLSLAVALSSFAQERKLTRAQLPSAVSKAIDREAHGATILGFATEREHGKTVYEAETLLKEHTRDLQIAEDGTINEIEEEVAMADLPAAVRGAIIARAKGAKVLKVESLTKKGSLVAYEAATEKNGHKSEVQVGPTGRALRHSE